MDSEYSLEREQFEREKVEAMMNNDIVYDFGLFDGVAQCTSNLKKEELENEDKWF